jgi:geranylgeranyl diphosphate synthase, type II
MVARGQSGITGADVFAATVRELSQRAPAIVAAASAELGHVTLGLRFGDGTVSSLRARRSRLIVTAQLPEPADVEVYFDARAMNLVFDLAARPADEVLAGSLDVRGSRAHVLAVWRTLRLLSACVRTACRAGDLAVLPGAVAALVGRATRRRRRGCSGIQR